MKKRNLRFIISAILIMSVSCDEPQTVVTNIVHNDGSITRKIEMRNSKNTFEKADLQIPFDNTWKITDSIEVDKNGDTTWVKRAEKHFNNVEEINFAYRNDSSTNGKIARYAGFSKKFRWFNTEYRFNESFDKLISSGYPVTSFLNDEEQLYFYSPDYIKLNKENGIDSIRYKMLSDSIDKKTENWLLRNIIVLWVEEFARLTGPEASPDLSREALKAREGEMAEIIRKNQDHFDSLWAKGVLLKEFIGDTAAMKFQTEADSAISIALEEFLVDFNEYSVKVIMPGKLIATNGFIDSTRTLLWPVKSDFFVTDKYEMWAESKTPNIWAWIVSGIFLLFVLAGILKKKPRLSGAKP